MYYHYGTIHQYVLVSVEIKETMSFVVVIRHMKKVLITDFVSF